MKYAILLPNGGDWGDAETIAELALLAEHSGWDGVFLEDYIVWQSRHDVATYDPWLTLGAMAMRTERLRLGTCVTPLARRRPWVVARQAATLDHLSNGRVILGVGLGDTGESVGVDISFTHFNEVMDARQRAQKLDEALDILAGLWRSQPFSYRGKHYQVEEVTFRLAPVQKPRIPIWIGGGWPLKGPVGRVARWDGSCLYKHGVHYMTPRDIQASKAIVESQRGSLEGYDIMVGGSPRRDDGETVKLPINRRKYE